MSTVRDTRAYPDISADQAYDMAESALEKIGFEIWKKRPLGWLLMAQYENETGKISGNVSCRPGNGASITITLDSDLLEEEFMAELAESFFAAVGPGDLD